MIKIEIDGEELSVAPGTTIIQAADKAKIKIPRFCYHEKLSIAANCRMCLVEVVNAPKVMPACATPVAEGMQVKTQSAKALLAQRSVMEFLLINHPLDCPICDQGGECELQDLSVGYGSDISRFNQGKRSVKDEDIGSLIATGMTRCIHCTRCVRFGDEIAGVKELGAIGRGENTEIRSFLNSSVDSELSGNMIDLCPVGALTSKPFRFSARAWELEQRSTVAAHDFIGSNINVHFARGKIKRVVPKNNDLVNENWLSDRDRFSYEGLNHSERLMQPMVRIGGKLRKSSWDEALITSADIIKKQVIKNSNDLIGLLSPNTTVEEGYLLQKLFKALGSDNIDFRLRNNSSLNPDFTGAHGIKLSDIEHSDHILLIGGSLRKAVPLLNHRIRKAVINGGRLSSVSCISHNWNYEVAIEHIVAPDYLVYELAGVVKYLCDHLGKAYPANSDISKISISEMATKIARDLTDSKKPLLVFGELALNHPDSGKLYNLFIALKQLLNCGTVVFSYGANAQGLLLSGAIPSSPNKWENYANITDMCIRGNNTGTYLLFNIEPEYDCADGLLMLDQLKKADKVICFSPYITDAMLEYADIVLPLAPFTETSGTFVNIDAKWQAFNGVIAGAHDSQVRPGWRMLCALASLLDVDHDCFAFHASSEVKQEAYNLNFSTKQNSVEYPDLNTILSEKISSRITKPTLSNKPGDKILECVLVNDINCYKTDNIVRRANSLQQTNDAKQTEIIRISQDIADNLGLNVNEKLELLVTSFDKPDDKVALTAIVDSKLQGFTAYLSAGDSKTLAITKPYGKVFIARS